LIGGNDRQLHKTKIMNKVRENFSGFFLLSFMYLVAASFIYACLQGICDEDWLSKNLAIGYTAEAIIFVWSVRFLKNGASEIRKKSHGFKLVKKFFGRVAYLMGLGIAFASIILCLYYDSDTMNGRCPDSILAYSLNIILPALVFLVWTVRGIVRINRIMR